MPHWANLPILFFLPRWVTFLRELKPFSVGFGCFNKASVVRCSLFRVSEGIMLI